MIVTHEILLGLFPGAGGATVSASPGVISVVGQTATVSAQTNITATHATILVTGQSASVSVETGTTVSCNAGVITVSGQSASIVETTAISATPGTILVSGRTASISAQTNITATPGVIQVSGVSATVLNGPVVYASPGVVLVTGQTATVTYSVLTAVSGTPATIVVSGQTATVTATTETSIAGSYATIVVSGETATISTGALGGRRLRGRRTRLPVWDEDTKRAEIVVPLPPREATLAEVLTMPIVRVPAKRRGRPKVVKPILVTGRAAVIDIKRVRLEIQDEQIAALKAELVSLAKRVTALESYIDPDDDEDEAIILTLLQRRA